MKSHLTATATVSIPVARLKKSKAWYQETFGFELLKEDIGIGWAELQLPESEVRIGLAEVQEVTKGGLVLILHVEDIDAAAERLREKKIRVSEIQEVPGLARVLTLHDLDEHPIMLRQDVS